jgi:hypothetical protein
MAIRHAALRPSSPLGAWRGWGGAGWGKGVPCERTQLSLSFRGCSVKIKEILNLDDYSVAEYKSFAVALRDGSTFRHAKAYVYTADAAQPPSQ